MAARAPPAAPAADEPGGPGDPPRKKKSRSGTSGFRRAFNWLRGKRRKKKAAGAESTEPAAPRAKKADDKARRAKGKGRGKAPGTWAARWAAPRLRPGWLRWGSAAVGGGVRLGVGAGEVERPRAQPEQPHSPPTLRFSYTQPTLYIKGGPSARSGIPGLSRKCWQSGSWDGKAIPIP